MVNRISREDFKVIAASLKAAYPKEDFMGSQHTFNLWYTALQDIDYPTLNKAALSYIMSNHFPPAISDIRQIVHDLESPADDIAAEEWARLMKTAADFYPGLHIAYSGSSILKLSAGQADLSRRQAVYNLKGLSFREFLSYEGAADFPPVSLDDLLKSHRRIAMEVCGKVKVLPLFSRYLKEGYYPFYKANTGHFAEKLAEVVNAVMFVDLPAVEGITPPTVQKARKMLMVLAKNCPQQPNMSALYRELETERNMGLRLLAALERAELFAGVDQGAGKLKHLSRPEKIFLGDTNLMNALVPSPDAGTVRETFFANQLRAAGYDLKTPDKGDFVVDGSSLFEIGGAGKTAKFDTASEDIVYGAWLSQDNTTNKLTLATGGTLHVRHIRYHNGSSTAGKGIASFVFDGGTLQLYSDANKSDIFYGDTSPWNSISSLKTKLFPSVTENGGVIDTQGNNASLPLAFTGQGTVTKAGNGTLTVSVAQANEGGFAVNGGTLKFTATGNILSGAPLLMTSGTFSCANATLVNRIEVLSGSKIASTGTLTFNSKTSLKLGFHGNPASPSAWASDLNKITATGVSVGSGIVVPITFETPVAFGFDDTYTLIKGAGLANTNNFSIASATANGVDITDGVYLVVESGNLVLKRKPYFMIKVR